MFYAMPNASNALSPSLPFSLSSLSSPLRLTTFYSLFSVIVLCITFMVHATQPNSCKYGSE